MGDNTEAKLHTVAWDGISLKVPEEWNIGAIGSEESGGYLRIDGPEMPRVEINWSQPKGFVDMGQVIDKYLNDTRKLRKKKMKEEITVARGDRALSRRRLGKSGVKTFSWEGSDKAVGAAWMCKKCGRNVIIQVLGNRDEKGLERVAEQIISSTKDHPDGDWTLWAVYDFQVELPSDFKPTKQKLVAGQVELSFARDTEKITVIRWGLANVALRDRSLDQWARKELWRQLKMYGPRSEPEEFHGHEGLRISGDRIVFHEALQRFIKHIRGQFYADRLTACVWHCPAENKIYVVQTYLDIANYGLADEIVARISCH